MSATVVEPDDLKANLSQNRCEKSAGMNKHGSDLIRVKLVSFGAATTTQRMMPKRHSRAVHLRS